MTDSTPSPATAIRPMDKHSSRGRRALALVALVLACLVIVLATIGVWARGTLLNTERFTALAAEVDRRARDHRSRQHPSEHPGRRFARHPGEGRRGASRSVDRAGAGHRHRRPGGDRQPPSACAREPAVPAGAPDGRLDDAQPRGRAAQGRVDEPHRHRRLRLPQRLPDRRDRAERTPADGPHPGERRVARPVGAGRPRGPRPTPRIRRWASPCRPRSVRSS